MLKRLALCVREYKKDTIISPILVVGEVVLEVLIPLLMAGLIDNGIEKGNMSYVLKIGAVLLAATVVSLLFGMLSASTAARASTGFAKNMRKDLYYKVQDFSFSNIDKFSTAGIVTRLTTDVSNIQNSFMMLIRVAARCPLMLIFSLVMSFSINSRLALIFVAIMPFLAAALYLIVRKAHPLFEKIFKTYDKLNNVVQENLRGIRVVKAFVREEHEKEKFNAVSEDIYRDFSRAEKIISFNMPVMQLAVNVATILIAWFGAKMIINGAGSMTTGKLMSFMTYTMQVLMSLMMLSMVFVMIVISRASAERVCEILDEEPEIRDPAQPVYTVADGSISFENVSFSYTNDKNKLCLFDVDLDIKSGETVGIIGGTGSSKSTLVQLIPRLYDATEGTVKVGGLDVKQYDLQAIRNAVAMVLQKNELFSGTIKENLRWGNEEADDEELVRVCRAAQADEFISKLPDGYDTYIEQGGANVSGGQKQRICIARALLKHPKVLILDDSTSAVDMHTDALIHEAFRNEFADVTKIIIAQRISSVEKADKIIVMDEGRVNAVGTHEQLLQTNEIYKEVYYSQVKGAAENG